jgi:aldehyde dehydrogenase (NAD+)
MFSPDFSSRFVKECQALLTDWYGPDPQKSAHLCRIVNRRNFDRLAAMLSASTATRAVGGHTDPDDLFISPTILTNVTRADSTMQEEIFGPILPIVPCDDVDAAIEFIRAGEKPLSMYIFSTSAAVQTAFKVSFSWKFVFLACTLYLQHKCGSSDSLQDRVSHGSFLFF